MKRTSRGPEEIEKRIGHLGFMKRASRGPEEIEKRIGHLGFMKRAKKMEEEASKKKQEIEDKNKEEIISEEIDKSKLCRVVFCGNPAPERAPGIFSYQKINKEAKGATDKLVNGKAKRDRHNESREEKEYQKMVKWKRSRHDNKKKH